VGTRLPAWVRSACDEYLGRLDVALGVTLTEIAPGVRTAAGNAGKAVAEEGRRLLATLRPAEHVAALDERGAQLSTRELAAWLKERMREGDDLAFLIGGPDGFAPEVRSRSNFTLALSRLTLPHALARVLLAEQLYRAHSILVNHPYHRD
jgi:23S rRNA (pseudouridine1915-N3)-methyltransferase